MTQRTSAKRFAVSMATLLRAAWGSIFALWSMASLAVTVPAEWTTTQWGNLGPTMCATCHPAVPDATLDLGVWLANDASFLSHMQGVAVDSPAMTAFASTATLAQRNAIRTYLLNYFNIAPVASAGAAQNVTAGATVTLDGSGSSDANGDNLTYAWTLTSKPSGSAATLSSASAVHPTFVADLGGTYALSLVVNDGQVNSPAATVQVTATAAPPSLMISATTLNFSTTVGTTTLGTVLISNSGGTSLVLSSLGLSGTNPGDYTLAPTNTCTSGLSLAPGASCALIVQFAPAVAGSRTATLSIAHNAANSPQSVALNGTATPAPQGLIELSATAVAFPDTQLGSSATQSVTVLNAGDLALTFSAFGAGGANPADFSLGGTCSTAAPLPASGGQCTLTITFQPSATGSRSGLVVISSNASNGSATISYSGKGVPIPAPIATFSTGTIDFGTQTVGGLFPPRSVQLTNTGTAVLNIAGISVSGAAFSNVSTTPCPPSLTPGAFCTIAIAYSAVAAGATNAGTIQVTTDAAGSPQTVALTGQGTASVVPVLVWSPAVTKADFGMVSAGAVSAVQTLTLQNQGPGGVTLALVNTVGANAANFAIVGGTCSAGTVLFGPSAGGPGATCTVQLQFAPGTAGAQTAQMQVTSSGSSPPLVTLDGVGLAAPASGLGLSSSSLTFAATRVGAQSLPLQLTLTGSGSSAVDISGMNLTGPYSMQSTTCPTVPFSLQAGSSCAVSVMFTPVSEGTATGTMHIVSDAATAVPDVALSGTGQAAASVSSGGCSIAGGDSFADPALWVLALLALCALQWRRRKRQTERRAPRGRP